MLKKWLHCGQKTKWTLKKKRKNGWCGITCALTCGNYKVFVDTFNKRMMFVCGRSKSFKSFVCCLHDHTNALHCLQTHTMTLTTIALAFRSHRIFPGKSFQLFIIKIVYLEHVRHALCICQRDFWSMFSTLHKRQIGIRIDTKLFTKQLNDNGAVLWCIFEQNKAMQRKNPSRFTSFHEVSVQNV